MAQYGFSVALAPGIKFNLTADTVDELLTEYEQVKGNGSWLTEQIMSMIPATEQGEGVGALSEALVGTVQAELASPSEDVPADEPETASERVDPWSGEKVRETPRNRSASRSAPSRATSRHPASTPASTNSPVEVLQDRWGGKWTIGLPEAPNCDHGQPAALKDWTSRSGKRTKAYKCANGAPGGDFNDQCEFFDYVN